MSNYSIAETDQSILLLEEKFLNRMLLGLFLVGFGGFVCWLSRPGASVGQAMGGLLGVVSIVVGSVSILRRGLIKVDQAAGRIEFSGGFRKFRRSPRIVGFDEVKEILIRTSAGSHTSYSIDVVIEDATDIVLDQTSNPTYANSIGEEMANRIGCRLRGRLA